MSHVLAFDPRRRQNRRPERPRPPNPPKTPKVAEVDTPPLGALGTLGEGDLQEATFCSPLEAPCTACSCGSFVQPPGEGWYCTACEHVALPPAHEQAGWAFCTVPGGTPVDRPPLPMPPANRDYVLVDLPPLDAPIGRCRSCWFTAPLSERSRCGRCEYEAILGGKPI
jgi:hypothetical protein